jgi:hypothetical protein
VIDEVAVISIERLAGRQGRLSIFSGFYMLIVASDAKGYTGVQINHTWPIGTGFHYSRS